jgi:hypothetical protein
MLMLLMETLVMISGWCADGAEFSVWLASIHVYKVMVQWLLDLVWGLQLWGLLPIVTRCEGGYIRGL